MRNTLTLKERQALNELINGPLISAVAHTRLTHNQLRRRGKDLRECAKFSASQNDPVPFNDDIPF